MTTYTSTELATRVMHDLGLIGAEEDPSDADLQWVIETNNAEIAMLGTIGLPIWNGSSLSVPQEYLTVLSRYCGLAVAVSFGLMKMTEAEAARREYERKLTLMASPNGAVNPRPISTNDARPQRTSGFVYATGQ